MSDKLSQKELRVLNLICQGLTSKEIGKEMSISSRTVESYCNLMRAKLGAKSSSHMVFLYLQSDMLAMQKEIFELEYKIKDLESIVNNNINY